MVGSSDSIAPANVVLNTIVAESFKEIADELENAEDFNMAVHDMIKKLFTEHQRILFNGNGYSEEWAEEAHRRGLPDIKNMVDAIPALTTDKALKLYEQFGVFTKTELLSRAEIKYEAYKKTVNIEAKSMLNISSKQIIPAVISYTTELANSIAAVSEAGIEPTTQKAILADVTENLNAMYKAQTELKEAVEKGATITDPKEAAHFFRDTVSAKMKELRDPADRLEMIVDKEYWPFPSYGDLIFEV